ncbi:MAG TPA: phosphoglycerate dehydrogenase, partial [Gallicola sp.]|nr:phosphoglycerate dehydrogenase [Gallicola sp.]
NGVKEMVMAGMLLSARDIIGGVNWVKDNKDDPNLLKSVEKAKKQFAGHELKGKKLGVLGLGAIGVLVANIGIRLGMEVYGYDPFISLDHAWKVSRHIIHVNNRDDIYRQCDYITVHVPATKDTIGMINKESIASMVDNVVVLNYSRNTLINDNDMIEALNSGKVAKYVTDFPTPELANTKNVIATPHLGASTAESEENCATMAVQQVRDYIEHGNIRNSVNFPDVDGGPLITGSRVTIIHKNIPQMLNKFTSIFGEEEINISNLLNKSKGDNAYTIIDVDDLYSDIVIENIKNIEGVLKVRTI